MVKTSRPGRFTPSKELQYQLNLGLGGPQTRPGRFGGRKKKTHKNVSNYPILSNLTFFPPHVGVCVCVLILWSSGLLHPEDGGSIFTRNAGHHPPDYTVSQPTILKYKVSDHVVRL